MKTNTVNLLKTDNIIKIGKEELLSSALSKLSSSHDAAFVFNDEKKTEFAGLINPYFCLIKSSLPANTKVSHCLFHPPRIYTNSSISKVAQSMNDSKIHYLPVFNEQNAVMGIISARRMLTALQDSQVFKVSIASILKQNKRPLAIVNENDSISTAVNLFKITKLSKLIVVNKEGRLKGLLSYYDLINFLITPKHKEHRGDKVGGKTNFNSQKISNFSKTYILTLSEKDTMDVALKMIIEKKIGSVVIIDLNRKPIGIITTKDFLTLIIRNEKQKLIEITEKNLSKNNRYVVKRFFQHFKKTVYNLPDIVRAKLFVSENKQGGLFKVVLSLFPKKGSIKVISREGKNLKKVLKEVKNK